MPVEPRSGFRNAAANVGPAGTAVTNHEAGVVAYIPGAGFVAAHDRLQVCSISPDGVNWGAIPTSRVLGALQMQTVDSHTWGVDALLPKHRILVKSRADIYPEFENTELGVVELTDTTNCWAVGPTEIMLLESGGRVTKIPRNISGPTDAVPAPQGSPSEPSITVVSMFNEGAVLAWTPPSSAGDSPITSYTIAHSSDHGASWTTITGASLTPLTGTIVAQGFLVRGLVNGRTYVFRVAAVNAVGTGSWSEWSVPITPAPTAPSAPIPINATLAGTAAQPMIVLTYAAPAILNGAPIIRYEAGYVRSGTIRLFGTRSGIAVYTSTTTTLQFSWPDTATYRAAYPKPWSFVVRAVNSAGVSAWSAPFNDVQ